MKIIKTEPLKDDTLKGYKTKSTAKTKEIDDREINWEKIKNAIIEVAQLTERTKLVGGSKKKPFSKVE